jgi:hypothetical protein
MTIAFWFWLVFAIWFLFGFWGAPVFSDPQGRPYYGRHLIFTILIALLGWAVFGNAFHTLVH